MGEKSGLDAFIIRDGGGLYLLQWESKVVSLYLL
jgi:hypothetical protein